MAQAGPREFVAMMAMLFGTLGATALAVLPNVGKQANAIVRNFFGILWVVERTDQAGDYRQLTHGRIKHGSQYAKEPLRSQPTSYFAPRGGVGVVISANRQRRLRPRVALVLAQTMPWLPAGFVDGLAAPQPLPRVFLVRLELRDDVVAPAPLVFVNQLAISAHVHAHADGLDKLILHLRVQASRDDVFIVSHEQCQITQQHRMCDFAVVR